ncbi:MAG TPA: YezD family protein [Fibrobacteria bacterium]|nr:YezD family protein [Fibrobacteria bacterium]
MSETQQRENWEQAVQEAIRSLRFGSVVVVVHEGKVTQIEKREKIRPEDRAGQTKASNPSPTHNGRPE